MELSATGSILGGQLIKALGNTLMHSLWQGVLLAVAGGLIISVTRKQTAALRYNLLLAAMLLFTYGVIVTFLGQLQPVQGGETATHIAGAKPAVSLAASPQPQITDVHDEAKQSLANIALVYFNRYCNSIVMIWFLIICIKSVRLAAGVFEIYQLRRIKINAISKYWEDKVAQLSAQLKLKQAIGIAESGIAQVPMVIGHLKPLILIPVGFINALSADEVEAILIHELAHIRRRDYLVNLLQSFMEIVFFFNPAVLWISQLLKAERENCCDDIALEQTASKYGYIQALLSCQEYKPVPGLGMAMAGGKNSLLERVKRIVNNNNQSLNIMEKTLLTIGLVTAGICTVAFSAKRDVKINPKQQTAATRPAKHITVDPKVGYVFKPDSKTTYSFNKTNSKISALVINGKTIPDAKIAAYRPQIDALLKQNERSKTPEAAADTTKGKTWLYKPSDVDDGATMHVVASKNGKRQMAYLFKRSGILYQVFMTGGHASAIYVNGEEKRVSEYQSKIDALIKEYHELAASLAPPLPPAVPIAPVGLVTPPPPITAMAPVSPVVAMTTPKPMAVMAPVPPMAAMTTPAPIKPMIAMTPMAAIAPIKPDGRFKEAADKLMEKGIIKDRNDFEMSLSNKRLTVDGLLQPEAIHQEILKIFVKSPADKINWHYSRHDSSESSDETTVK